jgi:hypothetical protein
VGDVLTDVKVTTGRPGLYEPKGFFTVDPVENASRPGR